MNEFITIFTPTYNRKHTLIRLYESLKKQTNNSFYWLIVDDGSTDNTRELVDAWIKESLIKITYIYQENYGKHIAHNNGILNTKTDYFMCVDSDDLLLENAIQLIYEELIFTNDEYCCGIVTAKLNYLNEPIGTLMPETIVYSSLSDLYEKYSIRGDTALIYKTNILRRFLFPKIDGERFMGEEYVYCQIDFKYKLFVSRCVYYVCEYQIDGYSKNIHQLIANNPKGYKLLKRTKYNMSTNFFVKYKASSLYVVGCFLSKSQIEWSLIKNHYIVILSMPLAVIIYLFRYKGKSV